ncbi:MAG: hypothetical protein E7C38_03620, partial [Finegoldia magna]|nr:hypothetical protein [Finegoldia magna]
LQEKEKIILIISHDYEFLCNSCNKILYLDRYSFEEFSTKEDKEKILAILMGKNLIFRRGFDEFNKTIYK